MLIHNRHIELFCAKQTMKRGILRELYIKILDENMELLAGVALKRRVSLKTIKYDVNIQTLPFYETNTSVDVIARRYFNWNTSKTDNIFHPYKTEINETIVLWSNFLYDIFSRRSYNLFVNCKNIFMRSYEEYYELFERIGVKRILTLQVKKDWLQNSFLEDGISYEIIDAFDDNYVFYNILGEQTFLSKDKVLLYWEHI